MADIKGKVGYISKSLAYTAAGTATLAGTLPPNSLVTNVYALVSTAFNSSGTDLIDVGTSGDPDKFAANLDVSSAGKIQGTLATTTSGAVESATDATDVYVQYDQSVADASAGAAYVVVEYIQL